ncbi:MAG: hypothetical protein ACQKBW_00275, partial [Puniceicoccales bacterium]
MAAQLTPTTSNLPQGKLPAVFMILFGMLFAGASVLIISEADEKGPEEAMMVFIMGSIFIVVGMGISLTGIYLFKKALKQTKLKERHQDEPWMTNETWASGRIKDGSISGCIFLIIFATVWNTISWAALIAIYTDEKNQEEAAKYFILLFPFTGLIIAVIAVYQLLRWMKFGTSVFEMAEVPGVIGGSLGGVIKAKAGIRPRTGVHLSLKSIHRRVTGSGKNRTTHDNTLWETEQVISQDSIQVTGRHSFIPVLFDIPYDCEQTHKISGSEEYLWSMKASAKMDGIDYGSSFTVPVFKTKDSRQDAPKSQPYAEATSPIPDTEIFKEAGIQVRSTASGAEMQFSLG